MRRWFDESFEGTPTPGVTQMYWPNHIGSARHATRRRPMMIEDFAITPPPNAERPALVVVAGRPGTTARAPNPAADRGRSSGCALVTG